MNLDENLQAAMFRNWVCRWGIGRVQVILTVVVLSRAYDAGREL